MATKTKGCVQGSLWIVQLDLRHLSLSFLLSHILIYNSNYYIQACIKTFTFHLVWKESVPSYIINFVNADLLAIEEPIFFFKKKRKKDSVSQMGHRPRSLSCAKAPMTSCQASLDFNSFVLFFIFLNFKILRMSKKKYTDPDAEDSSLYDNYNLLINYIYIICLIILSYL